jgi:hypothetical protein
MSEVYKRGIFMKFDSLEAVLLGDEAWASELTMDELAFVGGGYGSGYGSAVPVAEPAHVPTAYELAISLSIWSSMTPGERLQAQESLPQSYKVAAISNISSGPGYSSPAVFTNAGNSFINTPGPAAVYDGNTGITTYYDSAYNAVRAANWTGPNSACTFVVGLGGAVAGSKGGGWGAAAGYVGTTALTLIACGDDTGSHQVYPSSSSSSSSSSGSSSGSWTTNASTYSSANTGSSTASMGSGGYGH